MQLYNIAALSLLALLAWLPCCIGPLGMCQAQLLWGACRLRSLSLNLPVSGA